MTESTDTRATTQAWLMDALGDARKQDRTKLVGYLEEISDDDVFEVEMTARRAVVAGQRVLRGSANRESALRPGHPGGFEVGRRADSLIARDTSLGPRARCHGDVCSSDGYKLDLTGDCDVITLRRADGSVVCRFGMYATQEAIEEAIAEDVERRAEAMEEVYEA